MRSNVLKGEIGIVTMSFDGLNFHRHNIPCYCDEYLRSHIHPDGVARVYPEFIVETAGLGYAIPDGATRIPIDEYLSGRRG